MFDARWQQKAFAFIKDKFKPTELVSVIDFSENYTTFFQDAVQSSYWVNTQVTLFPIVAWYKCNCPESPTVREYIVFISDDLKHDYNAVHLFQTIAYGFICNNRGVRINRIIEFSDGCASQFKSRGPFADISNSIQDFRVPIERHFFGSRHGKNDSDGVSGVIKSAVRRAVTTNRCTVSSAEEMFQFCNDKLTMPDVRDGKCQHVRHTFFFIPTIDIRRVRPGHFLKSAVPGTRKFHVVKPDAPSTIFSRDLSCFCESCDGQSESPCLHKSHVSGWKHQILKLPQQVPISI